MKCSPLLAAVEERTRMPEYWSSFLELRDRITLTVTVVQMDIHCRVIVKYKIFFMTYLAKINILKMLIFPLNCEIKEESDILVYRQEIEHWDKTFI